MLSRCECGSKAIAYLADNGSTWIACCILNLQDNGGGCNCKVEAGTREAAIAKWNNIEYDIVVCPPVPAERVDFPKHWLEVFTDPKRGNLLDECCRRIDNKVLEGRKSNSRQMAPDIYNFYCECGRKHSRFCVGASGVNPKTGVEHSRPEWG